MNANPLEETSINKNRANRRKEPRVALPDLALKVRKIGLGMQHYEPCRSVDLSLNGLSFFSETLALNVPEKIDFVLNFETHEIRGSGVVCNQRSAEKGTQYGLMFIAVSPEISTLFNSGEITSRELEHLAKAMAEQLVASLAQADTALDKGQQLKQQQLFDACRSFLLRLGEMGVRMINHEQVRLQPIQVIKIFRDKQGAIVIQWPSAATKQSKQILVRIDDQTSTNAFIIDDLPALNVLQVLEVLSERIKSDVLFI
jgi:hypothetical protein